MAVPVTITRNSTYTAGSVIETCRIRLNKYLKASSNISPSSWIESLNKMQSLIFRLSGLKDIDKYLTPLTFVITVTTQVTSIKLSDNSLYKNISNIKFIESSILGICTYKPIEEFKAIANPLYYNPRLRKRPIWTIDGEYILVGVGDYTSLGTVTVKIYRTPIEVESEGDLIDLPNENIPELEDFILIKKLQDLTEPIPNDLAKSEARLSEMEKKAVEQKSEQTKEEFK